MPPKTDSDLARLVDSDVQQIVQNLHDHFAGVDQLGIAISYMVARTYAAYVAALSRDIESVDLSPARLAVVRELYLAKDRRLQMGELAARQGVSGGNVTRLVAGLVAQGLIRRETPENNRRSTFAELTPKGERAFESTMPLIINASRERLTVLSEPEKAQLLTLLTKLRHALAPPAES